MNEHKKLAIAALKRIKGDDLYLAKTAFKRFNENQMLEQHGLGGKTRNEILAEYEEHEAKIDAAIAWLEQAS